MKSINISKKSYTSLEQMNLPKEVLNTESKILLYNYKGKDKVVKEFHKIDGEYYATKLYTVQMLDTCKEYLPNSFVIPDYLLSVNNECIGFTVPKVEGLPLISILKDMKMDINDQIDYLKKVGSVLK